MREINFQEKQKPHSSGGKRISDKHWGEEREMSRGLKEIDIPKRTYVRYR